MEERLPGVMSIGTANPCLGRDGNEVGGWKARGQGGLSRRGRNKAWSTSGVMIVDSRCS